MPVTPKKYKTSDLIMALVLTTIAVSILGYVDYLTGEISIDVLYILCLCVVTWFAGTSIGILCVIELIFAKTTAAYYDNIKIGSHLYEWNTINYIFIYFIVCLLVGKLKKVLSK
jgi:hypothetical protein